MINIVCQLINAERTNVTYTSAFDVLYIFYHIIIKIAILKSLTIY
jgi:hypothetical protein